MEQFLCDNCNKVLKKSLTNHVRISEPGWPATDTDSWHFCAECVEIVRAWLKQLCTYDMNKDRSKEIEVVDENKLTKKEGKKKEDVSGSTRI